MSDLKSPKGRLNEKGVARVFQLRKEKHPKTGRRWTYQQIAEELEVCQSTIYNILKGKTHGR
jgi:hypothetical protein